MEHLLIVDGHHLLYRAYWAIPRTMKTSSGEQVNTAFGVASMLLQMLRTEEPDALLFCFDADEKTFRHEEFSEYKAGRSETPEDFYPQVHRALQLIDAFGIKSVSGSRMEADDFACTYARRAEEAGSRVTIVTGDRDLFQTASDRIRVAIPHKGYSAPEYMGPAEVFRKYGVTPAQIPAYKGLVGDASDNLSGVRGIGPKAAEALLQKYGTLEEMYANLPAVKSSWRAKLEQGREQAFFCQRMATLQSDIPLPVTLEELYFSGVSSGRVCSFFAEMEFTLVMKRFENLLQTPYGQCHFLHDGKKPADVVPMQNVKVTPKENAQMSLL